MTERSKEFYGLGASQEVPFAFQGLPPVRSCRRFDFSLPTDEVPNLLNVVDEEALLDEFTELGGDPSGGGEHEHLFTIIDELV